MQEENEIAPAASSHTEIKIGPTSLSASSRRIRTKELGYRHLGVTAADVGTEEARVGVARGPAPRGRRVARGGRRFEGVQVSRLRKGRRYSGARLRPSSTCPGRRCARPQHSRSHLAASVDLCASASTPEKTPNSDKGRPCFTFCYLETSPAAVAFGRSRLNFIHGFEKKLSKSGHQKLLIYILFLIATHTSSSSSEWL
jgi:hypothetical protein